MLYDSSNPIDADRALRNLKELLKKKAVIEITEKKQKRSLSQNAYLHLILSYFACETGCTTEYVKRNYFKKLCNSDLFLVSGKDRFMENAEDFRSTSSLDSGEMTLAIQRFRNWSSCEAEIYLPEPNEEKYILAIEMEIQKNKEFL